METKTGVALLIQSTPDELRNKLANVGDVIDKSKWYLGDITCYLKALVKERELNATVADVYTAVAIMANRAVSARTVEYYALNASFFSAPDREKYDPLKMVHFNLARQYPNRWQSILDIALSKFQVSNAIPSEEWLRQMITQAPMDDDYITDDAMVMDTEYTSGDAPNVDIGEWVYIERAFSRINSLIDSIRGLPLPDTIKDSIVDRLLDISSSLDEILHEKVQNGR